MGDICRDIWQPHHVWHHKGGAAFPLSSFKVPCKMATLIAKNTLPNGFSDEFNKSVAAIFPDSDIAKISGRTKTTQIIHGKKHFCRHTSIFLNRHESPLETVILVV